MLKIEKLTKYYGKSIGIKNLNLEIKKGEIFGFIGPNGAGKSTTIKCIMSLLNKNSGKIYINNREISEKEFLYKDNIGYLPAEINLYEEMTTMEMINYSKKFYQKNIDKRINELIKKFELDKNKKINELSFGNLKKLGIILAVMHEPELLILDEPTNGLDPLMQERFFELLKEEKLKGTTIFFSSHNLSEVRKICDRVGIIKNGKLITIETIKNLYKNNFVVVTIESNQYKRLKLPIKNMNIKNQSSNQITFIYKGKINELLKELNTIEIEHLTIENPSLEEIFINYYKEN